MDKVQLKLLIDSISPNFFKFITTKIKNSTYLSLVVFNGKEIIAHPNNNYNNWGNVFYELQKYKKCNLFDLGKLLTANKDNTVFWDEITHCNESLQIQEERKKFNIANGVSFLYKTPNLKNITIFINISSNLATDKNVFYKKLLKNKLSIINKLDTLLKGI